MHVWFIDDWSMWPNPSFPLLLSLPDQISALQNEAGTNNKTLQFSHVCVVFRTPAHFGLLHLKPEQNEQPVLSLWNFYLNILCGQKYVNKWTSHAVLWSHMMFYVKNRVKFKLFNEKFFILHTHLNCQLLCELKSKCEWVFREQANIIVECSEYLFIGSSWLAASISVFCSSTQSAFKILIYLYFLCFFLVNMPSDDE